MYDSGLARTCDAGHTITDLDCSHCGAACGEDCQGIGQEDAMTDKLPGEGETKLIERRRVRRECENCGEPAVYLNTYLNDGTLGARRNPASNAYGRDDCTFSSDHDQYLCGDCHQNAPHVGVPDGFGWCATFECGARFAHKFLTWEEREIKREEAAA